MALHNLFSKTPPAASAAKQAVAVEAVSLNVLRQLIPIRNFHDEILQAFTANRQSEVYPKNSLLFRIHDKSDSIFYLLKGIVTLTDGQGNSYNVEANTAKARFPLSCGKECTTTAVAKTDAGLLRVPQAIMAAKPSAESELTRLTIPEHLAHHPLLNGFCEHYASESLILPTLPAVAVKLREALRDDIDIPSAVKIIQLDPALSAKLIEVANCPLYMTGAPAKSCLAAVSRIGLNAARNLVIGFSLSHLFDSASPVIGRYLDMLWKESLHISTLSHVLAAAARYVSPEEALLAGLVCDIGALPFLNFAAHFPKDFCTADDLDIALPIVKGPVGHKLLVEWGFSEEFTAIPLHSDNWYHETGDSELGLIDLVILSRLHRKIGASHIQDLPAITSIPAASKLKDFALSPKQSLNVLFNAQQKIGATLKTLSV